MSELHVFYSRGGQEYAIAQDEADARLVWAQAVERSDFAPIPPDDWERLPDARVVESDDGEVRTCAEWAALLGRGYATGWGAPAS